jgi:hypothetical protein
MSTIPTNEHLQSVKDFDVDFHMDQFNPLSDDADGLTGVDLDDDQSEPDLGSPIELGGQDTDDNTLTISGDHVPGIVTQNLSGQSDSPPKFGGQLANGPVAGSGSAAGSVQTGSHNGDTTALAAVGSLGPSLAEGLFTDTPQQVSSPQTSQAATTVLTKSSQSGLSLGANIVLFGVLGFAAYFIVRGLFSGG